MRDNKNGDNREESTLKSGHCNYGWWSRDGTAPFNELYNLVLEQAETELLAFCGKERGVNGPQEGGGKECGAVAMVVEQEDFTFEAAWDLDDDDH